MTTLEDIRTVAFVGHPSAGKTTLVDALAFALGATPRKGSVADKTSICDTEPEEQEKGHTLQMAIVQAEKDGRLWTLMDTPGYPDFIADANAAMHASDLVVGVLSCAGRVTYNLRKKLEAAAAAGKGRMIVLTHVDSDNVDFDATLRELREKVGRVCVPVYVPDASGPAFSALKDVVHDTGSDWRRRLMDRTMDACEDEKLLEQYLETQSISDEELKADLPLAIAKATLVPVLLCDPVKGTGVDELLAFLRDYAPHPGLYEAPLPLDPEAPLAGVVFQVRSDPHVGKICVARIASGMVSAHDALVGPHSPERGEKPGGLFRMVGKKRESVESARPGEVVAFSKVEGVRYGEPFTKAGGKLPELSLPPQPQPMVALAVAPKSRADEQKIGEALHKLEAEDPTFRTRFEAETHELVVDGMSELHLAVMEARLKRRYGVEVTSHTPRIAYRETITKKAEGHYRHKKQSGGRGQFGECYIRLAPLPKGSGVVFTDSIVGGSIPRNLIPAVEKGMREVAAQGVLTHSQVIDIDYEVYDGKYHDVDSDEASFKIAAARAFSDAFHKAGPVLLEPLMELVISVPTESAGTIFSDLTSHRRGHVVDQWTDADGAITVIKAHAPLSTVQTYQRDLKSQTAGEGSYTMTLHDYAPVPQSEQPRILAQIGRKHEAE